jgi:putative transposase
VRIPFTSSQIQLSRHMSPQHHRRTIRLQGYDYSQVGAYFITICTHNRECLFGTITDGEMILNEYGRIVQQCWLEIPDHFPHAELDGFMVMPNHVHGIVVITDRVGATHASPLHQMPNHKTPLPIGPEIQIP